MPQASLSIQSTGKYSTEPWNFGSISYIALDLSIKETFTCVFQRYYSDVIQGIIGTRMHISPWGFNPESSKLSRQTRIFLYVNLNTTLESLKPWSEPIEDRDGTIIPNYTRTDSVQIPSIDTSRIDSINQFIRLQEFQRSLESVHLEKIKC